MKIVTKECSSTLEVKRSKFITHIVPYNSFESTLQRLQNSHPKARHIVTAFRYLNEFDQIIEGSSDDGEPKGTAGKPALAVLQGEDLVNVAVIIVRYFGGIKLGTGGLVRAYGDAVHEVLKVCELKVYEKMEQRVLHCSYDILRQVEYEAKKLGVTILSKDFNASVSLKVEASQEALEKFWKRVSCL